MRVNIQYCTIKLSMPWRQREILALVVVARGRLNVYDNGRGGVGLRRHVHGHDSEHGVTVRKENEQQAAQRRCIARFKQELAVFPRARQKLVNDVRVLAAASVNIEVHDPVHRHLPTCRSLFPAGVQLQRDGRH